MSVYRDWTPMDQSALDEATAIAEKRAITPTNIKGKKKRGGCRPTSSIHSPGSVVSFRDN